MLGCLACIMVWTTANRQDLITVTLVLYCTNVSWCLSEKEVNALLDELLKDVSTATMPNFVRFKLNLRYMHFYLHVSNVV